LCAGATAPVSSYYIARSTPRRHAAARRVFTVGLDESLLWRPPFGMTRECWKPIVFENCGHDVEVEIRRCRAGKANAVADPPSGLAITVGWPLQRTSKQRLPEPTRNQSPTPQPRAEYAARATL